MAEEIRAKSIKFPLDEVDNIRMYQLLVFRHRLKLEIKGFTSRINTLKAAQKMGLTESKTRKGALVDVNAIIEKNGGPPDRPR
jgi:hypothetical protein